MKAAEYVSQERFLTRATLAGERAARSHENTERKMWEDIAHCWRELARQSAPAGQRSSGQEAHAQTRGFAETRNQKPEIRRNMGLGSISDF